VSRKEKIQGHKLLSAWSISTKMAANGNRIHARTN